MSIKISSAAFENAMDRIVALGDPQVFARVMFDGARGAGVAAAGLAKDEPRRKSQPRPLAYIRTSVDGSTYKSKWASAAQQFFVHNLALEGKIPYNRTGQLTASITSAPFQEAGRVGFFVGTNLDYAQWVIGKREDQAAYHRDWWTPFNERFTPEAIREIGDVFAADALVSLRRYLKSGQ